MFSKVILAFVIIFAPFVALFGLQAVPKTAGETTPVDFPVQDRTKRVENPHGFDLAPWLIVDENSSWTESEAELLESVLTNTLNALDSAGLEGESVLEGYRFRRFAGQFAKDKAGKIALVNFSDREITLSDSVFLPEYEFFLYHELGHVVDRYSGGALDEHFHELTLQVDGVTALHDWTTAQGYFMRGQAHVHKSEATADAFALWVWVEFGAQEVPDFQDMPANADPQGILRVFKQAFDSTVIKQ